MRGARHSVVAIFSSLLFTLIPAAAETEAAPQPDPAAGQRLFTGEMSFQRQGPACINCHQAGGVAFPNGGTMGPDLTHVYSKMSAPGLASALQTLYFPAMNPLFATRPLTPEEQQDLLEFFRNTDRQPPPSDPTGLLAGVAAGGLVLLLAVTWAAGRQRIVSVRRALLERAGSPRAVRE